MRLPDPSTPNLKVISLVNLIQNFLYRIQVCSMNSFLVVQIDLLAEISQSPRILSEVDAALKAKQIKGDVDEYLKVILT